jgi:hypothetical protein
MPYKIKGNKVINKETGKVKGKSRNPKKFMRVLNAVEHGWKPSKIEDKYPDHPAVMMEKRRKMMMK